MSLRRPSVSRRDFLRGSCAVLPAPLRGASATLPNVVFILADDLGYGDLSCYNERSKIPTPNLDRLARQGMRFTNAHSPSAVCTPTRYGLLTGRYCWRTRLEQGVLDGFDPPLIEPSRVTIASLLRSRGYETACIGKWHLGLQWTRQDGTPVPVRSNVGFRPGYDVDYSRPVSGGPTALGFDTFYGIAASLDMSPYCFIENDHTVGIPSVRTPEDKDLFMNQVPGVKTEGFELGRVLPECTRRAVEFIRGRRGSRPFFLYLPLSSPHLPVVPNKEYQGRSKAGRYGDFVVEMDACVGAVLDALEKSSLADNTLVAFTSDNGGLWHWWDFREGDDVAHGRITARGQNVREYGHASNGPLRGTKADSWEGGHRVPMIVRWPGPVKDGVLNHQLVCLTDWLATFADMLRTRLGEDAGEDSFSLLPTLLDQSGRKAVREDLIHHSLRGDFAISRGEWKLIEHRGSGGFSAPVRLTPKPGEAAGQLYNLRTGSREARNLYLDKPEVVAELTSLLERYRKAGRTRIPARAH